MITYMEVYVQFSKEDYARKESIMVENSVPRDNCSASLDKPRDAE